MVGVGLCALFLSCQDRLGAGLQLAASNAGAGDQEHWLPRPNSYLAERRRQPPSSVRDGPLGWGVGASLHLVFTAL